MGPIIGLWGAGDQHCCGIAGAGDDGPKGADMGSWALGMWRGSRVGWAGTSGLVVPSGSQGRAHMLPATLERS